MAGNSKPRKQYNPRKNMQRIENVANGATTNLAATILAKTSTMTAANPSGLLLSQPEIDKIMTAVLAAISILSEGWCSAAFRCLTHWYRALNYVGQVTGRNTALQASTCGKRALDELSGTNSDAPTLTEKQYRLLRIMALELMSSLRFTPRENLDLAVRNSVALFEMNLTRDYHKYEPRLRQALVAVIKGDSLKTSLPADIDAVAARNAIKELGWIVHGLMPNSCLYRMPNSLAELRVIRRGLLQTIEQLEAGAANLAPEEKAAA